MQLPRIRTVKPILAKHEGLFDLEQETGLPMRFAWAMLPSMCDREGRFEWRPRQLKAEILPYDSIDFSHVLDTLLTRGYLVKYAHKGKWYGCIPTFKKHQFINGREDQSDLPSPKTADGIYDLNQEDKNVSATREPHVTNGTGTQLQTRNAEGKGREGKGREVKKTLVTQDVTFRIFDHWRINLDHPKARLTDKRKHE